MLVLESAHGHAASAETLPGSIFLLFLQYKINATLKKLMFLKKLMCRDAAGQHFSSIFIKRNQCHSQNLYIYEEMNGIIAKNTCFIAIVASETPRASLESPELREPPKLLPETSQLPPPRLRLRGQEYETQIKNPRLRMPCFEAMQTK